MRFNFNYFHCTFSTSKVSTVILLKEVIPSPDRKMIKLLTFENFFRHKDIAKTRSRMTLTIAFSCQNDAGSRAHHLVLGKSCSRLIT